MWDEIARHTPEFPTAMLSGGDADGYPYSVRCRPTLDDSARLVRLGVSRRATPTRSLPGPASLLCHRHDQEAWNLKSFLVRGGWTGTRVVGPSRPSGSAQVWG